MGEINFFTESIEFTLPHPEAIINWILKTIKSEEGFCESLNIIFCDDAYLIELNRQYLQHDTFTDIITFDHSEGNAIEGDIFISIERVQENAQKFEVTFENELHRVIIHGVLHLLGYGDKSPAEKQQMRALEDQYLSLLIV
ncbi:MAG: rRNA maturation RNase YbeY [Microscillaceae bacterium]|nr:rRNA maturation RNase YbeY [Microscillaceae bacterium]